ncbi:unnamed protein product [Oncorhynchus mykiss]|uniref:Integrin alpha third immunoglobulin-like domain-containing protein n=1 Tax=Oncorhynchus mykiss TaxID=8022 RepID=A0A060ZB65_ONCMY|nr:unnamed protein product [Oncorhynchus mykiss]
MVNARVVVEIPTHHHGDLLLDVFANASEDFLICHTDSPDIDPYQLVKTGNATVGRVYKVKQNEVERPEPQRKETVHVNCTSGDTCLRFVCEAKGLERDWSAVVKVMSRLWVQTFLEVRKRERERLIWELIAYHSDIFSTQYFTIATIIGRKEKCSKTALHQIEIAFCRILLL